MPLVPDKTTLRISFLALSIAALQFGSGGAIHAQEGDLTRYLISLAEAVNLYESGEHAKVVAKTTILLKQLENAHPASINGKFQAQAKNSEVIPVIYNTACGDRFRQVYAETLDLRALSRYNLKQLNDSIKDMKRAVSLCPNHANIHCDYGSVLVRAKKSKEAISELSRAIKLNDKLADAYFQRAQAYQQTSKGPQPQRDLAQHNSLASVHQNKIDSLSGQIEKFVQANKQSEALALDKQLVAIAPRDAIAIAGLAERLVKTGKYKEARDLASIAIALDPSYATGYRVRSLAASHLNDQVHELTDADKAFNIEPRSVEALNSRAIANLDHDRPAEAVRDFSVLIKRHPDFADGYINRSAAYLRLGETEFAINDGKRAITLAPKSAYSYQALGAAFRRAGKLKEAKDNLELSFRYSKNASKDSIAMAHFNLGAVLTDLGNSKEGNRQIDIALESEPGIAEVIFKRGAYDAKLASPDAAIRSLGPKRSKGTSRVTKLSSKKQSATKNFKPAVANAAKPNKDANQSAQKISSYKLSPSDLNDCLLVTARQIEVTPSKSQPHYTRAMALFALGRTKEAFNNFSKCAQLEGYQNELGLRSSILSFLCMERLSRPRPDLKTTLLKAEQNAAKTAAGNLVDIRYLLGNTDEKQLFPTLNKGREMSDITRSHLFAGCHLLSLGEAAQSQRHFYWVLDHADSTKMADEIVLALAESINAAEK